MSKINYKQYIATRTTMIKTGIVLPKYLEIFQSDLF